MKPFDIEAAKRGEPVVTRDGDEVEFFTFELKNDNRPIAGAYFRDGQQHVTQWRQNGRLSYIQENHLDLFIATRKREYWVNVYCATRDGYVGVQLSQIYASESEAKAVIKKDPTYLKTIKIHEEEI